MSTFQKCIQLKPNSITLADSELVRSWFEAGLKLVADRFEAGSKLVADRFEAKFHYAICFEAGSKLARSKLVRSWSPTSFEYVCDRLRTSVEPASVMEFGFQLTRLNLIVTTRLLVFSDWMMIISHQGY